MGRGLGMLTGTDNKFFIEDLGAGFLDFFVARGYAVAAGSLNVMGTNNDDVKSAETVAKVKERFIEQFGTPLFTVGHGASGGSMQQHLIGNAYPGLLDGIMPARSYPDVMSFLQPLYDCELLANVFNKSGAKWSDEQKGAVAGKYWGYCVSNGTRYPNARPDNCDASVKDEVANDPALKAKGVRCTFQDNLVNVFGLDPKTGFARNPFDNVGVQYGLQALNDGKVSFEQFVEVNGKVGGLDADGKIVPRRMVGDPVALRRAYERRPRQRRRRRARGHADRRHPLLHGWRAARSLRRVEGRGRARRLPQRGDARPAHQAQRQRGQSCHLDGTVAGPEPRPIPAPSDPR